MWATRRSKNFLVWTGSKWDTSKNRNLHARYTNALFVDRSGRYPGKDLNFCFCASRRRKRALDLLMNRVSAECFYGFCFVGLEQVFCFKIANKREFNGLCFVMFWKLKIWGYILIFWYVKMPNNKIFANQKIKVKIQLTLYRICTSSGNIGASVGSRTQIWCN